MLNGEKVVLELVQHEILETPVTTYNFEVADFHTYYVGAYDVLVHNKCFRGDLLDATGWTAEAAADFDAHHVFPRKFANKFDPVGLDWNNGKEYGAWWELHDHRNKAKAYNAEWDSFFKNNSPTKEQILEQGRKMAKKYGFDILF